jgi:hypothetical protein
VSLSKSCIYINLGFTDSARFDGSVQGVVVHATNLTLGFLSYGNEIIIDGSVVS